jgi:hypothetical protein
VRERLAAGRWPLLLYYSHVVTVIARREGIDARGRAVEEFEVIDPNQWALRALRVPYGSDGLPAAGESPMLWEVTPTRNWAGCLN